MQMSTLSVIIPSYNEENNFSTAVQRLSEVLTAAKIEYELIFVDDGSKDNTLNIINDAVVIPKDQFFLKNHRL